MNVSVSRTTEELLVVSLQGYSVRAVLVPREEAKRIDDSSPGIYVLMDWRRASCYVGQSGIGQKGVGGRICGHVCAKEPWWSEVVYFTDSSGSFASSEPRMWLEWELHRRAKRAFTVMSHVDERPVSEPGLAVFLPQILDLCRVLGVPFFSMPEDRATAGTLFEYGLGGPSPQPAQTWRVRGALAHAIVDRFNHGRGANGLDAVLARRATVGPKRLPWLEAFGIEVRNGKVVDWRKARVP